MNTVVTKHQHCCDRIDHLLAEKKIAIIYSPVYQEYGILLKRGPVCERVDYCPWCGTKLPESLRETL